MNTVHRICILGLGYVGLPTAAILANAGFDVLGVDIQEEVVRVVNNGGVHICEKGLAEMVNSVVKKGKLRASLQLETADVYIIAVPTPIKSDKSPNLTYIESATRMIADKLKQGDLIIVESTIPPRTCLDLVSPLLLSLTGLNHKKDYFLVHCPERVTPGKTLHELVFNDRIIGGATPQATSKAVEVYLSFVKGKLLETTVTTAEMTKLMENTYRDVNIALANEFSDISETIDVDVFEAIRLANHHHTVHIHAPGIGVGGHCIPVVPWFIVQAAPEKAKLIPLARAMNDQRPVKIVDRIIRLKAQNPGKSMAFFGLSFKPNVDDLSFSPAIEIVKRVARIYSEDVYVVEPFINRLPDELVSLQNIKLVSAETAQENAQILIKLVTHQAFEYLDLVDITRIRD
jgi:UDP-N-acetyl-D-mannosaminuronic acid dehydrogenase